MTLEAKIDLILDKLNERQSDFLTTEETAAMLKRSPQTIRTWTMRRKIPHFRRDGAIWFSKTEIERWIKAGRVRIRPT